MSSLVLPLALNTPSGGRRIKAVAALMISLTTIAVALRVVARRASGRSGRVGLWWDDWLALCAWVLTLVFMSLSLSLTRPANNESLNPVNMGVYVEAAKRDYFLSIMWDIGLSCVKLSAIAFYIRVFSLRKKWFRIATCTTGALIIGWCIAMTLLNCFTCFPVRAIWDPAAPKKYCLSNVVAWVPNAVSSTAIDLLILLLPLPMLKPLQMTRSRKFALSLVFILAYGSLGLSIARAVIVSRPSYSDLSHSKYGIYDYWGFTELMLAHFELGIGLISSCLPALITLSRGTEKHLRRVAGRHLVSTKSKTSSEGNLAGTFTHSSKESTSHSNVWADADTQDVAEPTHAISVTREVEVRSVMV